MNTKSFINSDLNKQAQALENLFFLTPSFPMIGLDQLKYWLGLVNPS